MKKIIYSLLTVALLGSVSSCNEDLLDPTLTTNKEKQEAIRTQEDVFGVLYGAYNRVSATAYYGRDYIIFGEVRSDNARLR